MPAGGLRGPSPCREYPLSGLVARSGALRAFSPHLQLETLYRLDAQCRITSTREPDPSRGPRFALIRSRSAVAWAVRVDTPPEVVDALADLVADEPPLEAPVREPRHAAEYLAAAGGRVVSGPAFTFPEATRPADHQAPNVVPIGDLAVIRHHFSGWSTDEIAERRPILGAVDESYAVCLCFCARRSKAAAEAGVETAEPYRGRGLAPRTTAAWAATVRAAGLVPVYSTQWSNAASLAVARKLSLETAAEYWTIVDP